MGLCGDVFVNECVLDAAVVSGPFQGIKTLHPGQRALQRMGTFRFARHVFVGYGGRQDGRSRKREGGCHPVDAGKSADGKERPLAIECSTCVATGLGRIEGRRAIALMHKKTCEKARSS